MSTSANVERSVRLGDFERSRLQRALWLVSANLKGPNPIIALMITAHIAAARRHWNNTQHST